MRITERDLKAMYARFLRNIRGEDGAGEGQYELDYATCYGGYKITSNGGSHEPFGGTRRGRMEMYYTLDFANRVLEHTGL